MFKKTKLLSALITVLSLSTSVAYAANKAIIVGVGKYPDARNNLPGVDVDVQLAKTMATRLGFSPANTRVLQNNQATATNFRSAMQWATQNVSANDKVMIYVSGHGSQKTDKNGDEPDGLDETLYLYDGHFVDDEFGALIKQIPSKNVVIIVDACHSGTVHRNIALDKNAFNVSEGVSKFYHSKDLARPRDSNTADTSSLNNSGFVAENAEDNHVLLAAAQDKQQSIATPKGSLFTRAVYDSFEALRQEKDTAFTWKTIFSRSSDLINNNQQLDKQGLMFNPNLQGSEQLAQNPISLAQTQTPRTTSDTGQNMPNWQGLVNIAQQGKPFKVNIKAKIPLNEVIPIEFVAPIDGYLNLVTVDVNDKADVLFPNKYTTNARVKAGEKFDIYQNMSKKIKSKEPLGKTLLFFIVTKDKVDFSELGMGKYNKTGQVDAQNVFARITLQDVEKFAKKAAGIDEGDDAPQTNQYQEYYTATAIFDTIK